MQPFLFSENGAKHWPNYRCSQVKSLLVLGLKQRRVEDRPQMDEPSQKKNPENASETELNDCDQQPALEQLAEAWNKKTAQRSDHVSRRTLSRHAKN
jgi:hypothetical protein